MVHIPSYEGSMAVRYVAARSVPVVVLRSRHIASVELRLMGAVLACKTQYNISATVTATNFFSDDAVSWPHEC